MAKEIEYLKSPIFYMGNKYKLLEQIIPYMTKQLKAICFKNNFRHVETETSKGILIPVEWLKQHSLSSIHINF